LPDLFYPIVTSRGKKLEARFQRAPVEEFAQAISSLFTFHRENSRSANRIRGSSSPRQAHFDHFDSPASLNENATRTLARSPKRILPAFQQHADLSQGSTERPL